MYSPRSITTAVFHNINYEHDPITFNYLKEHQYFFYSFLKYTTAQTFGVSKKYRIKCIMVSTQILSSTIVLNIDNNNTKDL